MRMDFIVAVEYYTKGKIRNGEVTELLIKRLLDHNSFVINTLLTSSL